MSLEAQIARLVAAQASQFRAYQETISAVTSFTKLSALSYDYVLSRSLTDLDGGPRFAPDFETLQNFILEDRGAGRVPSFPKGRVSVLVPTIEWVETINLFVSDVSIVFSEKCILKNDTETPFFTASEASKIILRGGWYVVGDSATGEVFTHTGSSDDNMVVGAISNKNLSSSDAWSVDDRIP